jgi:hypothetical protein
MRVQLPVGQPSDSIGTLVSRIHRLKPSGVLQSDVLTVMLNNNLPLLLCSMPAQQVGRLRRCPRGYG